MGKPHVRSTPTEYKGMTFRSKAEAAQARGLDLLIGAGHIIHWLYGPPVRLGCASRSNVYRPDFLVQSAYGRVFYIEVKGRQMPAWRRKRELWIQYGPAELEVVRHKSALLFETLEIIGPGKMAPRSGTGEPLPSH